MADGTERPSKWIPTTDPVDLAHLGKLGEETAELSAIVSRIIIQGIDENDPETNKPNRQALAEEIADVFAMAELAIDRFDLDFKMISLRRSRKVQMKREWHRMLKETGES